MHVCLSRATGKRLRKVVYTTIVASFDQLLPPSRIEDGIDYVVFADSSISVPAPWEWRPISRRERNPRITARWHKLHPHLLLRDYDLSFYIDGNVLLEAPVSDLMQHVASISPIALFAHPERNCPYAEADIVKLYCLDDAAVIDSQMAYYRALGYPIGQGLHVSNVLIRRHNDAQVIDFLEDWWRQVKAFSHRDQLSLDFMLRRHGIVPATIPADIRKNAWFTVAPHRRYHVDLATEHAADAGDEIDWLRHSLVTLAQRRDLLELKRTDLKGSIRRWIFHHLRLAKRHFTRLAWRARWTLRRIDGLRAANHDK